MFNIRAEEIRTLLCFKKYIPYCRILFTKNVSQMRQLKYQNVIDVLLYYYVYIHVLQNKYIIFIECWFFFALVVVSQQNSTNKKIDQKQQKFTGGGALQYYQQTHNRKRGVKSISLFLEEFLLLHLMHIFKQYLATEKYISESAKVF